jgi:hypothetical protein
MSLTMGDQSAAPAANVRAYARYERAPSAPAMRAESPWGLSTRGIAIRLFLTCWVVFALHAATDVVREHYLAIAIGDRLSFRVDEYGGLHPDLFEKPGYGWHIGNNPGGSMVAAVPYALVRPAIDMVSARVQARRAASGVTEPPAFETPRPNARKFFAEAWRRGLDVKLGLAALTMQILAMAPSSALAVVLIFFALRRIFRSDRTAMWLALLYAFGTPVLFRTGFLNHNLMLGHIAFAGFLALWNPGESERWSTRTRFILAGIAGGCTVLFDYSGVVFIVGLGLYGLVKRFMARAPLGDVVRHGAWYTVGTLGPIFLLWWYQWRSFGNFLLPGQHWMPPVKWIEQGYQGYGLPQGELLLSLLADPRYGLLSVTPLFLLALAAPFLRRPAAAEPVAPAEPAPAGVLPRTETLFLLGLVAALWIFFAGSNYTRLQFNTGIRYMAPAFPFLFVPAAVVLMRLRPMAIYLIGVVSVLGAWSLAMVRIVDHPLGALHPVVQVLTGGFELPVLTTLSRMPGQLGGYGGGVSPLPLFCLTAALLYGIWAVRARRTAA